LTSPLLTLIRRQRSATSATENLSEPDFLKHFASSLTELTNAPDDYGAIARTLAVVMCPGPDASGAVELLREAGFGTFELEDLEGIRRHPATGDVKVILTSQECRDRFDAGMCLLLRDRAVEAGSWPADRPTATTAR
jgi:hypothetical protein